MRRVDWSIDALLDLEEQVVHIAKDDPAAARRVAQRIRATGEGMKDFATGHPGRAAGTYEKSVARLPYVIIYALADDDGDNGVVTILRVIHTARDWSPDAWPQ